MQSVPSAPLQGTFEQGVLARYCLHFPQASIPASVLASPRSLSTPHCLCSHAGCIQVESGCPKLSIHIALSVLPCRVHLNGERQPGVPLLDPWDEGLTTQQPYLRRQVLASSSLLMRTYFLLLQRPLLHVIIQQGSLRATFSVYK